MPRLFDLQGHRGARGLKPENTFPAFETALDVGVTTIETDVHLTADGVPVLYHDAVLSTQLCRPLPGSPVPDPVHHPPVRSLSLAQLRRYRADCNPDPPRFPRQDASVTPAARLFAECHGLDPFVPPALADLLLFTEAYAGDLGATAGKTAAQRARARRVRFELELKRVPFRPGVIGDGFNGTGPALLERRVVEVLRAAGVVGRTTVRSFDHRCVRALRRLEPRLTAAVLVANTAPVDPARLVQQADAHVYSPRVEFTDETQVRQVQTEGMRVVPWTVNDPEDWVRLIDWGF
jgi:glycerophosphoryl diester phosphodiesterase